MRAKVLRSSFFTAITHCIGVVDKKPAVPVLSHVLLTFEQDKITLQATDLDHSMTESVEAQVDTFGAVAVHGQILFDIIRKLSDNSNLELSIADQGKKMVIVSDKARFEMQTISASEFPKSQTFSADSNFTVNASSFKQLIDLTKFAMAIEETRYNLNGIYMHTNEENTELKAAATDGHRLSVSSIPIPECNVVPGIYSRKTILEIRKLLDEEEKEITISSNANQVQFHVKNVTLTARLVDGTFPNYAAVVPEAGDKYFVADRKSFIDSLERVSVISDDKSRTVKLELTPEGLRLSSINITTGGSGKDELSVEQNTSESWEACFNAKYLVDVAEAVTSEKLTVYFSGKLSPILILPDNAQTSKFVVMPMRV